MIAPVVVDGRTLVPIGAELSGAVVATKRVGLGLSREVAMLHVKFDTVSLPDGQVMPIGSRVTAVDNARERVDPEGRINGIRATASFASMISGFMVSIGFIDPMLLGFTLMTSLSVFRIPESEIVLPAGTEIRATLTEPLALAKDFGPSFPTLVSTRPLDLDTVIRALPFRTYTADRGIDSDITNLAFVGTREAIGRAFEAAGWARTDARDAFSSYGAVRAIVENQGYKEAPMSVLLLDGQAPELTLAKTLDTFFQRHHARVFGPLGALDGEALWTASSTQDIGIGLSIKAKSLVHVIDENIDHERDKIVADLVLTGCVSGVAMVDRPWIPDDARNSTGDHLQTDKKIAVVRMSDCTSPVRADANRAPSAPAETPAFGSRVFRNVVLTVKNDLFRGNMFYQGYSGLVRLFRRKTADLNGQRSFRYADEDFLIVQGADANQAPQLESQRPTFQPAGTPQRRNFASKLEFSFNSGYSRIPSGLIETQPVTVDFPFEGALLTVPVLLPTTLDNGFALSPKVTLNHNDRLSSEFAYTFSTTRFLTRFTLPPVIYGDEVEADARIRQFSYNLAIHVRRNGARVRPFGVVGGGMKLLRLNESAQGRAKVFNFAFKDVGVIQSAWDFGSKPPLEGGGIFQGFLQYGGGVLVHLTQRYFIRGDFRESLSQTPDFWTKSAQTLEDTLNEVAQNAVVYPVVRHGILRQQHYTIGFGVGF